MDTLSEHRNEERIRAIIRTANASKLRYPLLILIIVLLVGIVLMTGQLVDGIFEAWPD